MVQTTNGCGGVNLNRRGKRQAGSVKRPCHRAACRRQARPARWRICDQRRRAVRTVSEIRRHRRSPQAGGPSPAIVTRRPPPARVHPPALAPTHSPNPPSQNPNPQPLALVPYWRLMRTGCRMVMLFGVCWNMANISSPPRALSVATSDDSTTGGRRNMVVPAASRSPLLRRGRSTLDEPTGLYASVDVEASMTVRSVAASARDDGASSRSEPRRSPGRTRRRRASCGRGRESTRRDAPVRRAGTTPRDVRLLTMEIGRGGSGSVSSSAGRARSKAAPDLMVAMSSSTTLRGLSVRARTHPNPNPTARPTARPRAL